MGDTGEQQYQRYAKALLGDMRALERMVDEDWFDDGPVRIGAEQEMFLVDGDMQPAPVAVEVIERAADPRLVHELALFNVEANATPQLFAGDCLSQVRAELSELVATANRAANEVGASVVLTGILPTLSTTDIGLHNITPKPRYRRLNDTLHRLRGGDFHVLIKGTDELSITHDSVMMEACNTSFQLHYQVQPSNFVRQYNLAQLVAAPVLAAAVNSPLFLDHRLWSETRIALFMHSVDIRKDGRGRRDGASRVYFGNEWVKDGVVEVFRDQIARHRIVLPIDVDDDPKEDLDAGRPPALAALRMHNGTIYRWNRVCYGITDGKPHLRIENRFLPAGPTIADEMANAALYFGLLAGLDSEYDDVASSLSFTDCKQNFFAAARYGLRAHVKWIDGKSYSAGDLIANQLIPAARAGLRRFGVEDIDYLDIIEERVASQQTGSQWATDSLARMGDSATPNIRARSLVAAMLEHGRKDEPVHRWPLCDGPRDVDWKAGYRTVGQFMTTDLFTLRAADLVDLAANVMHWRHIQHVPVEDDDGRLVGILSYRNLLQLLAQGPDQGSPAIIRDIMKTNPVTVSPQTRTLDAMRMMREQKLGCLPVVDDGRLVGIITQTDLIEVSARLLEDYLAE